MSARRTRRSRLHPRLLATEEIGSIPGQETRLILLNLALLSGIAVAHALFAPILGLPTRLFFAILFGRFLMQAIELMTLQAAGPFCSAARLRFYAHASIGFHLAFAFALSCTSGLPNSHYVVLMLVPILASAFRYRPGGIVLVVASAAALTVIELRMYARRGVSLDPSEYFEAASVVLIYVVVAAVAAVLARLLRAERSALRSNLEELERTRDRLVHEEKLAAVGRLSSAIAHEIRNPVALIQSSIAMASSGQGGLERGELEQIISEEAARLERLTSDFLAYARDRVPRREPSSVETLLAYVISLARARSLERGVALEIECPEDLGADVDPFQMHQALLNLILNGIDATGPGGRVLLAVAPAGTCDVILSVENSGDPIPPTIADRIFEPFFTTKASGSGLGLAITRRIVEGHGGDVVLAVNEPGCVRFSILLPEARCPRPLEMAALGENPAR
jgi:two-component system, NtrC family, sensor histidine kinase HydH